jgi:hypothetical protein
MMQLQLQAQHLFEVNRNFQLYPDATGYAKIGAWGILVKHQH